MLRKMTVRTSSCSMPSVASFSRTVIGAFTSGWSAALIFDRDAIAAGQVWRLWTGHLVHFGWLHCAVDTAVLLFLGWVIVWPSLAVRRVALIALPLFISAAIYLFDPGVGYYAGLSALNLGLFVFLAIQTWRRDRSDWLWPAVLLVCLAEIVLEAARGGSGGGLIAFSDPSVRIAISAHLAGVGGGLLLCLTGHQSRRAG